jgi:hypothetical protein
METLTLNRAGIEREQSSLQKEIEETASSFGILSLYLDDIFEKRMPNSDQEKYEFLQNIFTSQDFFGLKFKQYQPGYKNLLLRAFKDNFTFQENDIDEVCEVLDTLIELQKKHGFTYNLKRELLENIKNPQLSFIQHILMGILFVGSLQANVGLDLASNPDSTLIKSGNRNFRFGEPHISGHNKPGDNGVKLPHTHLGFYVDLGNDKKESFALHILIK